MANEGVSPLRLRWAWALAIQIVLVCTVSAQIVRDGSLGSQAAGPLTGGPNFNIPANLGRLICNQQELCNLYHSFSDFNVNTDQSVNFEGPASAVTVANVLARVTGLSRSNIDGLIRTTDMPNANFFLINPNGVLFGPNAKLDVGGAFVVTTAHEVHLTDEGKFVVSTDPDDSLLTSAPPSAFGFLPQTPAGVEIDQSTLAVAPGQSLSIVSGDVQFSGGNLVAPGGRVNIVAPGPDTPVTVEWEGSGGSSAIDLEDPGANNQERTLAIRAGRLTIERSRLTSLAQGSENGVNIDINVTDEVIIRDGGAVSVETSGIGNGGSLVVTADRVLLQGPGASPTQGSGQTGLFSTVHSGAQGNGGSIAVHTNHLHVVDSAQIASTTQGTVGVGGHVTIGGPDAQDTQSKAESVAIGDPDAFSASKLLSSAVATVDGGHGGDLTVRTRSLQVFHGSSIESSSVGIGGNGNIVIDADHFKLDGQGERQTGILASFEVIGSGISEDLGLGSIHITTSDLSVINSAQILSTSEQLSMGGLIQINANSVLLDGADSKITVLDTTRGRFRKETSGQISIQTSTLELASGAEISASTNNRNQAGTILITADDHISLDGPGTALSAAPEPGARGKGGNIVIGDPLDPTGDLWVQNGAKITVETQGRGDGGDIVIGVNSASITDNASITSTSNDIGNAGRITLTTNQEVLLKSGGSIQTAALDSQATGGDITVSAGTDIRMENGQISAAATGDGGNISLDAGVDIRLTDSLISAEAAINGGDISLVAGSNIVLANSTISALAGVEGGDIQLIAPNIIQLFEHSTVTASAFGGGGKVSMTAGTEILMTDSVVSAASSGNGGDIELIATQRVHLVRSNLIGRAGKDGGRISIDDPVFVILDHSIIDGRSGGIGLAVGDGLSVGDGLEDGDPVIVAIAPEEIFLCNACQILTNAIQAPPELDLAASLLVPAASLLGAEAQLQAHCAVQFGGQASSFTVSGRGGMPVAPGRWLPSTDLAVPAVTKFHP